MQNHYKLLLVALLGTLCSVPALSADKAFVTVNGTAIPQAQADLFIAEDKARGLTDTPEMRNKLRENLIRRELMLEEAKKAGFDKKPEVAAEAAAEKSRLIAQAEVAKQTVIIRAFVNDYVKKNQVSDAQLKSEYDAQRARGGNTEFKARHILVKTESEARNIIDNLKKGEKFEDLAKQSIDAGSKNNGGDLGWSSPAKFVKPFGDALSHIAKGKYTESPVKSDFGYHIIKVDDTRALKVPSFEELKPMLQRAAQNRTVEKMGEGLRAKAKIQ